MIGRRGFFGAAAASVAMAKTLTGEVAKAATPAQAADAMANLAGMSPRGAEGRLVRLATLDLESQQDFTLAFRLLHSKQIRASSISAFERVLEAEGIDPTTPLTADQVRVLAEKDPAINIANKSWLANQQVTWKTLQDHFHGNFDRYMSELEAGDKAGPGALVLSPKMTIPEYTKHEIHIQPGGWHHLAMAQETPLPCDGLVRKVLDLGCGWGGLATALKERFPDAEVWGIDVGGPMVRWAHHRAVNMGVAVNFAQRLGEDSKFESGSFDMVGSDIMFHEVSAEVEQWADHRFNMERWAPEYRGSDFLGVLRAAGFEVKIDPKRPGAFQEITATKPA